MKYKMNIEYLIPEFSEIELYTDIKDEEEAKKEALEVFVFENPEAIDASIVKVSVTNGD